MAPPASSLTGTAPSAGNRAGARPRRFKLVRRVPSRPIADFMACGLTVGGEEAREPPAPGHRAAGSRQSQRDVPGGRVRRGGLAGRCSPPPKTPTRSATTSPSSRSSTWSSPSPGSTATPATSSRSSRSYSTGSAPTHMKPAEDSRGRGVRAAQRRPGPLGRRHLNQAPPTQLPCVPQRGRRRARVSGVACSPGYPGDCAVRTKGASRPE